ncbi:acyl-CoA N-acyltransferase [Coniochaeta sp. 2T2.1]|nr:acyl-CoA N-acyltransferase [Coniochaeta sp. 2T2.1]
MTICCTTDLNNTRPSTMSPLKPEHILAKVLLTPRLSLVLLEFGDDATLDFCRSALGMEGRPQWTRSDFRRLCYSVMFKPSDTRGRLSANPGVYVIRIGDDAENGTPIGMINVSRRVPDVPVDLGFMILPEYRRLGYGTEAAGEVLRYFREEWMREICLLTQETNVAARKLAERIGFVDGGWVKFEGKREVAYVLPGMEKLKGQKVKFWGDGKVPEEEGEA